MITYRLADSIPQEKLLQLQSDLRQLNPEQAHSEHRRRIEQLLDQGYGSCLLKEPTNAQLVISTWQHFDPSRYLLMAWVVMPNHVHVLVKITSDTPLPKIIQSWKSYTGRRIAELSRAGARGSQAPPSEHIWFREYWDRYIRDERHLKAAINYLHDNPVKAGLATSPEQYLWSSAYKAP